MSDHPNFAKLKKTQVGQLKPCVKEGYLVKKGADFHTWKKRWFVMKEQYIWYFPKNTGSAQPKGIIELDGNSSATLVLDQKKPTIVIKSVHRTQEINSDTVEDAKSWVDAINAHVKTLGSNTQQQSVTPAQVPPSPPSNAQQTTQQSQTTPITTTQGNAPSSNDPLATPLPWQQVQQRIQAEEGKWDPAKIKEFMVTLGKVTCDQYLYSIMQAVLSTWQDDVIAAFWWDDFCDGDLEDLETVVAGMQGDSTVAVGTDGKNLGPNETVFVLGRDENGAKRLASIYQWVVKREEFNWSEVTRCVLSAVGNWGLKTYEPFLEVFVNQIIKNWSASEIAAFVSYIASYARKNEDQAWETWPPHVITFFKKMSSEWDAEKKKSFLNIVTVMWDWPKESIQRLNSVLHDGE
ncbi:pleckstrin, putative [Entamoeba invadens IP1]|uniref:Pleckstrin, putative n=2 Tax=Entamoeba invadens TaxID=33085 RepID=A0A0A1U0S0_ENTIV|nr:pleckstrin, putative [Entamoeba invadens IP1]ELP84478.1 pleckstrin, putative [Entamoeba invadens IP1]BAN42086.1 pleckstrin, putative [Entamoeba invadens]|eukprot:XP_004183824.1 pleckstrin, putative [Entamoeba invadens IP1]